MPEIITSYLTNNPCYKAGRTIEVKGLMLHSIGCPQPDPRVFVASWNSPAHDDSCVHGFVGAEETIITLPCMETPGRAMRGWHGGGASNNTHIGVEMCEPDCIKYTGGASFTCSDRAAAAAFVERTTANAVELFARLCRFHGLDPLLDIISHAEGYALGIATNHGDPDHMWRQLGMDYSMDHFRADVAARMREEPDMTLERFKALLDQADPIYNELEDVPDYWREDVRQLIAAGAIRGNGTHAVAMRRSTLQAVVVAGRLVNAR